MLIMYIITDPGSHLGRLMDNVTTQRNSEKWTMACITIYLSTLANKVKTVVKKLFIRKFGRVHWFVGVSLVLL